MTAVVGFVDKDRVWIGADSQGTAGDFSKDLRKDSKVFRVGEFLFGYTTSYRMGQIIRYGFKPDKQPSKMSDFRYLCTLWTDKLRTALKEGGFSNITHNVETGGRFLLGYRGRLYTIHSDFQISESMLPYAACGCGEAFSLGAMFASKGSARSRVVAGLTAAEKFSAGVGGPFVIKSIRS